MGGQVLSGGMGSEEGEHVVMCCFCPLLCPVSISCYLLRLLITINAHFPFHFIPSLQLLKFLWNKRDDRLPIFQSANFLSPQVVSQIDAHRQCQLKLVGVIYSYSHTHTHTHTQTHTHAHTLIQTHQQTHPM